MVNIQYGSMLKQEFLKIQFQDCYFSENLVSNPRLFTNDVSFFSVIFDKDLMAKNLSNDVNRINNWAFQCKMSFHADPNKKAQEVFSCKIHKSQPSLVFNNKIVTESVTQKYLGMFLDT